MYVQKKPKRSKEIHEAKCNFTFYAANGKENTTKIIVMLIWLWDFFVEVVLFVFSELFKKKGIQAVCWCILFCESIFLVAI